MNPLRASFITLYKSEALLVLGLLILTLFSPLEAQIVSTSPIPHAHSHNDYAKKKPLWGALANGCTSVEIDVFARKGKLKVAHIPLALGLKKDIEQMYIKPLVEYIKKHGHVYEGKSLELMVDFKTNSEETLPLMLEVIEKYKEYFSYYYKGEVIEKPLKVVISGRMFSYDQVKDMDSIYVFLDGNTHDCTPNFPPKLVARGSIRYGAVFTWNGKGEIPESDAKKLEEYVQISKECNIPFRFYAMPEKESIWEYFLDSGIYWINVDNSKKFKEFYEVYKNKKSPRN